ncbi:MAG: hypothetical protein CME62_09705 [Halobacteriovoraceae bacterium]|nr:hypothetical protein [Halobacteriovoraceae bacterium]|tara:strand:- start:19485 stop:21212 length:1728 start_codon:yes stop_codon:yes gene_type:complete
MSKDLNNVLTKILYEAKSYSSFEQIEKLVEDQGDLSQIPVQPLYVSLLTFSSDQLAKVIPRLSKKQRKVLLDLDLWRKDQVDVQSFETWIESYARVEDLDIIQDFVDSEDFLLYLKSRVNVYTFDVEDPEYPDHDFYFLTDDNLLLIEYSEEFKYPNELKFLVRNLYDKLGVEAAYTQLFKLMNDSFASLEESGYQEKKERLRDYGFVDYYEALEKLHSFASLKQVENFILAKKSITPNIDSLSLNQNLHSSALTSFDKEMENIYAELLKCKDSKRLEYLHFTFVRLVNSTITLKDALKGGRVELTRIGEITKSFMELGLQKVKVHKNYSEEQSVFNDFDFFDLYKIGSSLINLKRQKLIRALKKTQFVENEHEGFLGAWWVSFLENSEQEIPKVKAFGAGLHAKKVNSLEAYAFWEQQVDLLTDMLPFIQTFFKSFQDLKEGGHLHSDFYLNYEVENIDFEAIIISSFVNYSIGNFSEKNVNKMGVTIVELKQFFDTYFEKKDQEYVLAPMTSKPIQDQIQHFMGQFGFDSLPNMHTYLYGILSEHLSGYEFDTLDDEDFKHIGGPILLNFTKN